MSGHGFAFLKAVQHRTLPYFLAWMLFAPTSKKLQADLVIALTSGESSVLLTDTEVDGVTSTEDQVVTGVSLGFTGTFFDTVRTTVDVSSNGNLNWSGDKNFGSVGGPTLVARISPLWDDFLYLQGTGGKVLSNKDPGKYFAVTWQNVPLWLEYYSHDSYTPYTFQVAWFGAPTQIGNFQFQPNDIAFSYATDLANPRDLYGVVGLNRGSNTAFIPFPGDTINPLDDQKNDTRPGFMYAAEAQQILPSLTSDEFFLFRPDGNNSYNATRESLSGTSSSAVPEPSSLLLVTAAISTGTWWHRRKRQRLSQGGAC